MLISFAHIVNPFKASDGSDLETAQPINFESMRIASSTSQGETLVTLMSAQYPEDIAAVPDYFHMTENLTDSVIDQANFKTPIKLPLIKPILDRLYNESTADFLIYTNVDIGLQPHFYQRVSELIASGYDALIINRRRIPAKYLSINDLPEIYQDPGKSHPGFDCFVFHRDLYPKFQLASICIGVPYIGITMAQNIFALANKYRLIEHEHLTFHIGMEVFRRRAPLEYVQYNKHEFYKAMNALRPHLSVKKLPYARQFLPIRLLKWGLHPSIPIRIALRLELQYWKTFFQSSN